MIFIENSVFKELSGYKPDLRATFASGLLSLSYL